MRHRLYFPVMLSVAVTNASPTTVSLAVFSVLPSVLIYERFAAANAKALIFLNLFHPTYGQPQRRSSVAIDATVFLRNWGGP